jgi:hypothetical protein
VAIRDYFSDKAVVVYHLTAVGELVEVGWHVNVDMEDGDWRLTRFSRAGARVLAGDGGMVGPRSEQMELEKEGVCFFKCPPGRHTLKITPASVRSNRSEPATVSYIAEPGQVVNLGELMMDGRVGRGNYTVPGTTIMKFGAVVRVDDWYCTKVSSEVAVDGLMAVYPEIFRAMRESIVNE